MAEIVTILMPVRNALPYLEECLISITEQKDKNWELIAVNDHSSDGSDLLLQKWSEKDGRIKTFKNRGRGIISALRLAYEQSGGSLITRMDADDVMSSDKIGLMRSALSRSGPGHVATGLVKYFSDGQLGDGYHRYEQWLNGLTTKGRNFDEIYKECVIPSPCWMLHRADLDMIEAFRPDIYPEDYDLCFRMHQYGLETLPINKVLHYWRDHSSRTSRTDDHYSDNRFLELKLRYFLEIDRQEDFPLVIWGAGQKGKLVAQLLQDRHEPFLWITDNPRKSNTEIYGIKLSPTQILNELDKAQVILLVANPEEQQMIKDRLSKKGDQHPLYVFC